MRYEVLKEVDVKSMPSLDWARSCLADIKRVSEHPHV
jgi:hypothetical protein